MSKPNTRVYTTGGYRNLHVLSPSGESYHLDIDAERLLRRYFTGIPLGDDFPRTIGDNPSKSRWADHLVIRVIKAQIDNLLANWGEIKDDPEHILIVVSGVISDLEELYTSVDSTWKDNA